jgi:hypothetical protein
MSGPGPFYGDDARLTALCVPRGDGPVRPLWVVNPNTSKTLFCVDFDYSNYQNEEADRDENGLITFNRYQVALLFPVLFTPSGREPAEAGRAARPIVDVGAGVGRIRFAGDAFEISRIIVPVRASVRLLRLAAFRSAFGGSRGSGLLKLDYNGMIIPQHLRTADFGVQHEFDHTYLSSVSVVVDFSELLVR